MHTDGKQIKAVTNFCYFQFNQISSEFPSDPGKKGTWVGSATNKINTNICKNTF